jgi:hypothetical protein
MARKVKCKGCGEQIDQSTAYKHIHTTSSGKSQNHYYCSLEEYESIERDKALYKQIQYLTDEILGYPCVNNNRNKRIQDLQNAGYTNEQIYRCFKEYKNEIEKWIEFNKIDKEFNKSDLIDIDKALASDRIAKAIKYYFGVSEEKPSDM